MITQKKNIRRSSNSRRGDCEDYSACEDICEDVYNEDSEEENEGDVERCLNLSYNTVEKFEEIAQALEEPYYADLRNIEGRNFERYLDVSLKPWIETTKAYSSKESESVLIWISSNTDIAKAIVDAYKNYEDITRYKGVRYLFSDIKGLATTDRFNTKQTPCAETCHAIAFRNISGNFSYHDLVIEQNPANTNAKKIAQEITKIQCKGFVNTAGMINTPVAVGSEVNKYRKLAAKCNSILALSR